MTTLATSPHCPGILTRDTSGYLKVIRMWRSGNGQYVLIEWHNEDAWSVTAWRECDVRARKLDSEIYHASGDRHSKRSYPSALYCARRACVMDGERRDQSDATP